MSSSAKWSHRLTKLAALTCIALSVTGCIRGLKVRLEGTLDRPVISVAASIFEGSKPCLDRIRVEQVVPQGATSVVWEVRKLGECAPFTRGVYGIAPGRLETVTPSSPLKPGAIYRIRVGGPGWLGAKEFEWFNGRFRPVRTPRP
jgi:hypothetical protein